MADFELDLRGLNCPVPVMRMKKKMQTMSSGQTLHVLATDPGSVPDFAAYVKHSGDSLLKSDGTPEGGFEFLLKKV